ncbi:MAG: flagellar basal body-associated FliL family protein [Nitrospirae bacterium]|nr:flagellar basal body-associated FliL family protein [Candidatus Manganitrophaceae bacterium]
MAEEEKKGEPEKKEPTPKGGSKKKLILIGGAALVLILAGGGFFLMKKGSSETAAVTGEKPVPAKASAEHGGEKMEEKGTGIILDLDPFVVNLADTPEIRYLKVTIKLELSKAEYTQVVNDRTPQIRDSMLILLSSKEYAAIRTVEGKMELRDEILQRLNTILGQKVVKTAYFTDFVAQ